MFASAMAAGLASYAPLIEKATAGITEAGSFDEPEQWRYDWERHYTKAEWLEQVPTFGGHSRLPPERLAELLAGFRTVLDASGGSFTMGYATVVVTATRLAATPDGAPRVAAMGVSER
jgi:hypothetical protein